MENKNNTFGLTLGGGGVKGFAYIGVFKSSKENSVNWGNMAGVSVGALAIAIEAAGYDSREFREVVDTLDLKDLQINEAAALPVVREHKEFMALINSSDTHPVFNLYSQNPGKISVRKTESRVKSILNNIIAFSKDKALLDGDYLEKWIYHILADKGIRTFGDLKDGFIDKKNPNGYKIRMNCVDATRIKSVVLPDDLVYYGIDPDEFEVAKAIRISTSIPFAFKPVVIKRKGINHYLIDGGVFDTFPYWLIDNSIYPAIGFHFTNDKKIYSLTTPINIIKNIISSVYDIGIPSHSKTDINYIEDIKVSDVATLDVNLSDEAKAKLIESGYNSANNLFNRIVPLSFAGLIKRLFR